MNFKELYNNITNIIALYRDVMPLAKKRSKLFTEKIECIHPAGPPHEKF